MKTKMNMTGCQFFLFFCFKNVGIWISKISYPADVLCKNTPFCKQTVLTPVIGAAVIENFKNRR
jgi:hypothetical protein